MTGPETCGHKIVEIDGEVDTACTREPGHGGEHTDGIWTWDDDWNIYW